MQHLGNGTLVLDKGFGITRRDIPMAKMSSAARDTDQTINPMTSPKPSRVILPLSVLMT